MIFTFSLRICINIHSDEIDHLESIGTINGIAQSAKEHTKTPYGKDPFSEIPSQETPTSCEKCLQRSNVKSKIEINNSEQIGKTGVEEQKKKTMASR